MNNGFNQTEKITSISQLSSLALKLQTLRLQKNLSTGTLSQLTKITEEDLIAFEADKKVPTEEEKRTILEFLH